MVGGRVLTIERIVKQGADNVRVLLDDGRRVKVPLSMGIVGGQIPIEDIRDTLISGKVDWIHASLKKAKRKPKVLASCVSTQDANETMQERINRINKRSQNDLKIIKACALKYLKSVNARSVSPDELEDLGSDIYIHLFERNFFEGYDPTRAAYTTWVFKAVKNYMITMWRSRTRQFNHSMLRMDAEFESGSGAGQKESATLHDIIADRSLISSEEEAMLKAVTDRFKVIAVEMDDAALFEDGLPSYFDIYEAVRDNDFDALIENYVGVHRKKQFMDKYQEYKQRCTDVYSTEMLMQDDENMNIAWRKIDSKVA